MENNNQSNSLGEFIMILIYTIMGVGAAFTVIIEAKFAVNTASNIIKTLVSKMTNICRFRRK